MKTSQLTVFSLKQVSGLDFYDLQTALLYLQKGEELPALEALCCEHFGWKTKSTGESEKKLKRLEGRVAFFFIFRIEQTVI